MRFFLIDKITHWDIGKEAAAIKNVSLSEDFFSDHFPRRPIMPGMLIIEGMAQLSGLLLEESLKAQSGESVKAVITIMERIKFREMVRPGTTLTYKVNIVSLNSAGGKVAVIACNGERLVLETKLSFGFKRLEDGMLDARREDLLRIWRQEKSR
ncbi:3-hydroxyacyl-ACP dehydratase FabZ family protein [Candidatus Riflebacteria bacterium]